MKPGKLNIVIGGQYGSEGKGKVVAWLATNQIIDVAICSFSSQAGHTAYIDGKKYLVQQVPMSAVQPDTLLLISQGAIIDLDILRREIDFFGLKPSRLRIHPKAMVIQQEHKDLECQMASGPKHIASTCKGNGAAMADYVLRKQGLKTIGDYKEFKEFFADTTEILNNKLARGAIVLAEGAQGFSLDIYHGMYPHTTSRGCTPMAEMARIGANPHCVGDVYGCYRTYPIRVGNIVEENEQVGFSGGNYYDQEEVDWKDVTVASGSDQKIEERTTVTNRIRRVFTFSNKQFSDSLFVCGVTKVCVMFGDYITKEDVGKTSYGSLTQQTKDWIDDKKDIIRFITHTRWDCEFSILGTGPDNKEMIAF
jgi:adenylosuccinate synthase